MPEDTADFLTQALFEFRKQGGRRHHSPDELGRVESSVLLLLSDVGDEDPGLRIVDLARELEVTASTLTQTTTSLFKLGYLERQPDPLDRRAIRLHLTEAGKQKALAFREEFRNYCRRIVAYLGEEDTRTLAFLLNKMSGFLEAEPKPARD
jgi:DNA-binding MarR family transcriptional regulator